LGQRETILSIGEISALEDSEDNDKLILATFEWCKNKITDKAKRINLHFPLFAQRKLKTVPLSLISRSVLLFLQNSKGA